jgi:hypothetical protein
MTDNETGDYDAAADIQRFIDEAVENRGEEAVAKNIDSLLAGLRPVMQVPDKDELDIPGDEKDPMEDTDPMEDLKEWQGDVPVVPAPEPERASSEHALCELCGESVALEEAIPGRGEKPVHRECYANAYDGPEWLID